MKIKRQKKVGKLLTFYKYHFGIDAPYNVMVDGTFAKAALVHKINIKDQLAIYLEAPVNLKTTKCILEELEAFGPLLYGPLKVLQQYERVRCGHKNPVTAAKCMKKQVNSTHKKHIIATQDPQLSDYVRSKAGVPLLFISHKAIMLEAPSEASKEKASEIRLNQLMPSKTEQERITELKKATFGEEKQPVRRKRKKAKGPNPLSCKKKKSELSKKKKKKKRKSNPTEESKS